MPRFFSSLLLSLLIASSASAVTMDWTLVADPGNAADADPNTALCGATGNQPCGAVPYLYNIGTYEVTNAQYAEFLNAKAASDPLGLYNVNMGSSPYGGIAQSCSPSCTYTAIAGRENMPVSFVTFYNALRFANWMNNGQGSGDTETGAYTLDGGTPTPSNGTTVTRNPEATIFVTSEDEWYKAAYYDPQTASYFDYPAGTNEQPTCMGPGATANTANCGNPAGNFASVGSYTSSSSPYGTFDQGGNAHEWNEAIISGSLRGTRGGWFGSGRLLLSAFHRGNNAGDTASAEMGFRVAPEPGKDLLLVAGVLSVFGLAGRRRGCA